VTDWSEDSKDFPEAIVGDKERQEIFAWCEAHRLTVSGSAWTGQDIEHTMTMADKEGAPQHVKHFIWAYAHFPERMKSLTCGWDEGGKRCDEDAVDVVTISVPKGYVPERSRVEFIQLPVCARHRERARELGIWTQ
jgi:hypothetical protein